MNKVIIALLIVLAAFIVVGQDGSNNNDSSEKDDFDPNNEAAYENDEFYEVVPPDKWKVENIPPGKYNELKNNVNGLQSGQLKNLDDKQLEAVMSEIDSNNLGKLTNAQMELLGKEEALIYFQGGEGKESKLKGGYTPKNHNERKLLKQIGALSNVDLTSPEMTNLENLKVSKKEGKPYRLETPMGSVVLRTDARVEMKDDGLHVYRSEYDDNGVVLTRGSGNKGEVHVKDDKYGYRLVPVKGEESPYKVIKEGQPLGSVNPPYDPESSRDVVFLNFDGNEFPNGNYISVDDNDVHAHAIHKNMRFNLAEDPPFENYKVTAAKQGKVTTIPNKKDYDPLRPYKIITTPDKVKTEGEEPPFPLDYNQEYVPENGEKVEIEAGETEEKGGWVSWLKEGVSGVFDWRDPTEQNEDITPEQSEEIKKEWQECYNGATQKKKRVCNTKVQTWSSGADKKSITLMHEKELPDEARHIVDRYYQQKKEVAGQG